MSDHFRVRTDLDHDAALEALASLEELRAALLTCLSAKPGDPTGRIAVVVLDRGWNEIASVDVGGFALQEALFQPLIVIRAGSSLWQEEVIKHELVHVLSRRVVRHQPRWLAEGLATYFETITYDEGAHRLRLGAPPPDLLRAVQQRGIVDLPRLFATSELRVDDRSQFYPSAWVVTHYLMNHQRAALVQYELGLATGLPASEAWSHTFPALPPEALDREVRTYLDGGQYELLLFPFDPPATRILAERTLDDADVHATRALLLGASVRDPTFQMNPRPAAEVRNGIAAEVREALRQAPSHALAQAVRTWMLGENVDLESARAATRAHPEDWMAWFLLLRGLKQDGITAGVQEAALAAALAAKDDGVTVE